jgi:hypothetical protein
MSVSKTVSTRRVAPSVGYVAPSTRCFAMLKSFRWRDAARQDAAERA